MRTIQTKIYKFKELSKEAQQKVINKFWDINFDYDWYDYLYDDAKEVGIKITDFDLSENSISGEFLLSACEVAQNIFNSHGDTSATYKTAEAFMEEWQPVFNEYMKTEEGEDKLIDIENDFLNDILEDYRILLQKEYEYQISEEAIKETIESNEYEFYANGTIYHKQ